MQRVAGRDELCGVALQADSKRSGSHRSDMAEVTDHLIERLTLRFNMEDELVAATVIARLSSWPDTLQDAKSKKCGHNLSSFCQHCLSKVDLGDKFYIIFKS